PDPGSNAMKQGVAMLTAEFRILDPVVYAADSSDVSVSVVPKSLGGIVAPVFTPITTEMTGDTSYRFITVGGDADAPFSVTFNGPWSDPKVNVDGVEVVFVGRGEYDADGTMEGRGRTVERETRAP